MFQVSVQNVGVQMFCFINWVAYSGDPNHQHKYKSIRTYAAHTQHIHMVFVVFSFVSFVVVMYLLLAWLNFDPSMDK